MGLNPLSIIQGVLGIAGATKKPKTDPASQSAANWENFQLGQAKAYSPAQTDLLGFLAKQAGLTFNPGSPAVSGTPGGNTQIPNPNGRGFTTMHQPGTPGTPAVGPSFGVDESWNPFDQPGYANANAALTAKNNAIYKANAPKITGDNLAGIHGMGHGTEGLAGGLARDQASFNRQYFANADQERKANIDKIMAVISSITQGGNNAAQALAQIGQQNQARNDAAAQASAQSLAPLFQAIFAAKDQAGNGLTRGPMLPTSGVPYAAPYVQDPSVKNLVQDWANPNPAAPWTLDEYGVPFTS